jgi:LacI family transcriptional regulator
LSRHNLNEQTVLQATGQNSREFGYNAVRQLLNQANRPTAVVCYNDIVAFGVLLGVQSLGLEPGKDIAVTGFDDIAETTLWRPALTTIAVGPRRIGEAAVALLLERIANPDQPPRQVIVPPKLIVRESSGSLVVPTPT